MTAGSVHDARIWRNSAVNTLLCTGIAGNKLLIGDSAYPISTYLCKPYPQSEANTNPVKKNFNSILSEERIVIEHVFGQLKSRFQMLRTLLRIAITLVPKFIVACCVLHNVGKYLNDPFADDATKRTKKMMMKTTILSQHNLLQTCEELGRQDVMLSPIC